MYSNDFKVIGFALGKKKSSKGCSDLNNSYTFIDYSFVPLNSIYFRYLYNMYFKFFETVHFTCILSTIEWKKALLYFVLLLSLAFQRSARVFYNG